MLLVGVEASAPWPAAACIAELTPSAVLVALVAAQSVQFGPQLLGRVAPYAAVSAQVTFNTTLGLILRQASVSVPAAFIASENPEWSSSQTALRL